MPKIRIPHNYTPRDYQLPLLEALDGGIKRAVGVWHRRAGKDKTALNYMIKRMMQRVGVYYYFLPTYSQAKKTIWDNIDGSGFKFINHFPKEIVKKKNEAEMKMTLTNGSLFQLIGTDNINSIVGTNPVGCVFSEYALQNPLAWDFIRPILRENKGWALFIYTPRGHNHGYDLAVMARDNPNWFYQELDINATGTMTDADVQREIDEGMDSDLAQQEFYVSFEGAMAGSYYSKQLKKMRVEGRACKTLHDAGLPVHTVWDIGIGDAMAIWFFQLMGNEVRWIDYYESSGEGLLYYANVLHKKRDELNYIYGDHFAPHDIEVQEMAGAGETRKEAAANVGIRFLVVPRLPIEERIDAVRRSFNRFWFDEVKCKQGLVALEQYHKEYDEKRREWKMRPFHDWSSHAADSIGYGALAIRRQQLGHYDQDPELEEIRLIKETEAMKGAFDPTNPFNL